MLIFKQFAKMEKSVQIKLEPEESIEITPYEPPDCPRFPKEEPQDVEFEEEDEFERYDKIFDVSKNKNQFADLLWGGAEAQCVSNDVKAEPNIVAEQPTIVQSCSSRDPRLQQRMQQNEVPVASSSAPIVPPRVPMIFKQDAETQTTKNDGSLQFELSFKELEDLPDHKKEVLLKFMKVIMNKSCCTM